jgi:hypothetical protein
VLGVLGQAAQVVDLLLGCAGVLLDPGELSVYFGRDRRRAGAPGKDTTLAIAQP